MILEGPIVTTAAAFASSFGLFNLWIIFLLSILGDLAGDLIYFEIGKRVGEPVIRRYGHKIGFENEKLKIVELHLKNNFGKTMIAIKFVPFLTIIGLLLSGALNISRKRFILLSFLITLPRAIFFTIVGYYFGVVASSILKYYNLSQYVIIAIAFVGILSYFIYKWLFKKINFPIKELKELKN
jgi:membrane protein DedA with SNARE-associated domain